MSEPQILKQRWLFTYQSIFHFPIAGESRLDVPARCGLSLFKFLHKSNIFYGPWNNLLDFTPCWNDPQLHHKHTLPFLSLPSSSVLASFLSWIATSSGLLFPFVSHQIEFIKQYYLAPVICSSIHPVLQCLNLIYLFVSNKSHYQISARFLHEFLLIVLAWVMFVCARTRACKTIIWTATISWDLGIS